jgi:hypothetical protein
VENERERTGEAAAALHRADEHAHRDGKDRGKHAAQDEEHPPGDGERTVRLRQDREERPLVPGAQALHGKRMVAPSFILSA